ncbi:hypothetical protein GCM10010273_11330 [Streptomyces lavendulocolor]
MGITPRRRPTASITAAVHACLGAAPVTPAAADEPLRYVALGDSFAASPQVPPPDIANLLRLRSLANHPHVAARALGCFFRILPGSRALARASAALSSVANAPQWLPPPPCIRPHQTPLPDPA